MFPPAQPYPASTYSTAWRLPVVSSQLFHPSTTATHTFPRARCIGRLAAVTPTTRCKHRVARRSSIPLPTAQAARSVLVRTRTRTGPRSRISQSEEESKIELLNAITVCAAVARPSLRLFANGGSGKKLKKRLEDLEKRAGSSSASPEQKHEELPDFETTSSNRASHSTGQRLRSSSNQMRQSRGSEMFNQHHSAPADDKSMFSQQFTRQLSTSPPPHSYASIPTTDGIAYSTYPQSAMYCGMPASGMDVPLFPQYLQSIHQYGSNMTSQSIKQEYYGDDEMSPFSMSYASMAGVDVSTAQTYDPIYVSSKSHLGRNLTYPSYG